MEASRKEHKKKKKKGTMDIKMDYVPSKEGHARPFVAYFPTGFDPVGNTQEDGEGAPLAEIKAYQATEKFKSKQHQLVATTQGGQVDFVGCNYSGEAAAWQPCSYALGVFNKEKGTLKLVPLAGEKIFRMEPRVRGVDYGQGFSKDGGVKAEAQTPEMGMLKRKILTETFGSQKSRMRAQRIERGLVKTEALGNAREMESLFQEVGKNEALLSHQEAFEQANLAVVRNVPPYDLSASTPEGAYPLDKLITQEEWGSLDVEELKAAAKKARDEDALRQKRAYPNFVLSRLQRLRVEGDKEGNDRRARILVYLRHLLAFHNAPDFVVTRAANPLGNLGLPEQAKTVDLTQELGIPGVVVATFLKLFTGEGTFGMTDKPGGCHRAKQHKELLISYALVLGLAVDDFQADPYDLAFELKCTVSQLRPHYKQLGCQIEVRKSGDKVEVADPKSAQGKWKVRLTVPLQFPSISRRRGRGR